MTQQDETEEQSEEQRWGTELAKDVERLEYPDADPAMMELGIDHFINALHEEEMWLKVEQSCPKTLPNCIGVAFGKQAETQTSEGSQDSPQHRVWREPYLTRLSDESAWLPERRLAASSGTVVKNSHAPQRNLQRKKQPICWGCEQPGHVRRNCPKEKTVEKSGASTAQKEQRNGQ